MNTAKKKQNLIKMIMGISACALVLIFAYFGLEKAKENKKAEEVRQALKRQAEEDRKRFEANKVVLPQMDTNVQYNCNVNTFFSSVPEEGKFKSCYSGSAKETNFGRTFEGRIVCLVGISRGCGRIFAFVDGYKDRDSHCKMFEVYLIRGVKKDGTEISGSLSELCNFSEAMWNNFFKAGAYINFEVSVKEKYKNYVSSMTIITHLQ